MKRTTIDFGIDLGTTNSSIAELRGTEVKIFKNYAGHEFTPSAVYLDKKGAIHVGEGAKERLEDDPKNSFSEFKLQMGSDPKYQFERTGQPVKPEELSAEVLKSLKADVKQANKEDLQAAVITVPAAFDLAHCEATKKAAQLAGFSFSPLLLEPVAAALAYGFQSESDKVFWLVYDFGGGTFDAALMQSRDGEIQVINHGGDNHLGGKLIDWAIVNELLVPMITKEYQLTDFRLGNEKWLIAFAKLKMHAEKAKIRVAQSESSLINEDYLCNDDRGQPIEFEYELKRSEVIKLATPFIFRSINICKKVLQEKRLEVGNIEKVLLAGGTTLVCGLREMLSDPKEGLGIPLESRIDPLTIVARGAAIFSGTVRFQYQPKDVSEGQYFIELDYNPLGDDPEPLVGGKFIGSKGEDFTEYTIEFVNAEARPEWRSGKIRLGSNGDFVTNLWAEKGKKNTFLIELNDSQGTQKETLPESISYTCVAGGELGKIPLTHNVGIGLVNDEMETYFEKGVPLPAKKLKIHHTAFEVRQGQEGDSIRIPIVEGENKRRASRNLRVGDFVIHSHEIKRTLPAGSEVEVKIEIDESRQVTAKAFIPILDEEYEQVFQFGRKDVDVKQLKNEFEEEKKRLERNREQSALIEDEKANQALKRIEDENMLHDVQTSLVAAPEDRDAADKCQNSLLHLKIANDEIEDALELPSLLIEAEKEIESSRAIVNEFGQPEDKKSLSLLEGETRAAIGIKDIDLLKRKINEMFGLKIRIFQTRPEFWLFWFEELVTMKAEMRDQMQAEQFISQGRRAINNNDVPGLKAAVQQLNSLLPLEKQKSNEGTLAR